MHGDRVLAAVTRARRGKVERPRGHVVRVLARAVTWHAEHRVLLNDDRTVVFH